MKVTGFLLFLSRFLHKECWCTYITTLKKIVWVFLIYSGKYLHSFSSLQAWRCKSWFNQITDMKQQHTCSFLLLLLGTLTMQDLPVNYITCPTREKNILNHCYSTIKDTLFPEQLWAEHELCCQFGIQVRNPSN